MANTRQIQYTRLARDTHTSCRVMISSPIYFCHLGVYMIYFCHLGVIMLPVSVFAIYGQDVQ